MVQDEGDRAVPRREPERRAVALVLLDVGAQEVLGAGRAQGRDVGRDSQDERSRHGCGQQQGAETPRRQAPHRHERHTGHSQAQESGARGQEEKLGEGIGEHGLAGDPRARRERRGFDDEQREGGEGQELGGHVHIAEQRRALVTRRQVGPRLHAHGLGDAPEAGHGRAHEQAGPRPPRGPGHSAGSTRTPRGRGSRGSGARRAGAPPSRDQAARRREGEARRARDSGARRAAGPRATRGCRKGPPPRA